MLTGVALSDEAVPVTACVLSGISLPHMRTHAPSKPHHEAQGYRGNRDWSAPDAEGIWVAGQIMWSFGSGRQRSGSRVKINTFLIQIFSRAQNESGIEFCVWKHLKPVGATASEMYLFFVWTSNLTQLLKAFMTPACQQSGGESKASLCPSLFNGLLQTSTST